MLIMNFYNKSDGNRYTVSTFDERVSMNVEFCCCFTETIAGRASSNFSVLTFQKWLRYVSSNVYIFCSRQ